LSRFRGTIVPRSGDKTPPVDSLPGLLALLLPGLLALLLPGLLALLPGLLALLPGLLALLPGLLALLPGLLARAQVERPKKNLGA